MGLVSTKYYIRRACSTYLRQHRTIFYIKKSRKNNFWKKIKRRKLFIFGSVIPECQYSLARIGNRRVKNREEPRA